MITHSIVNAPCKSQREAPITAMHFT